MEARAVLSAADERPFNAREAFLDGDLDACVAALSAESERIASGDALLARALIRQLKFTDAESVLRLSRHKQDPTVIALLGAARARQGDYAGAAKIFDCADSRARKPAEKAAVHYQRALGALMAGDMNATEELATRASTSSATRGFAEELLGWVKIRRGQHRDAIPLFLRAAANSGRDVMLESNALMAAASIASEIYSPETMRSVDAYIAARQPTKYTRTQRFHIFRASAWFAAMYGSYDVALERLRTADREDTAKSSKLASLCDRAYLALTFGEDKNGWDFAERAYDIALSIDWSQSLRDEPYGLLYLIGILADRRPLEVRRLWKTYDEVRPRDPLSQWSKDIRTQAFEEFTIGLLERNASNMTIAKDHFSRAYTLYRRIGYDWRAILCLLAREWSPLVERGYIEYVQHVLKAYPNSWLRTRVEKRVKIDQLEPLLSNLTSMQLAVLDGVIRMKTNPEIADELGRSVYTVKDHVKDLFRRTGCRSRVALARFCLERGLTPGK